MKINVTYPARTIEKKVKNIKFIFDQNIATVELLGEHPEVITISLNEKTLTATKLETIREFLAQIIADAAGVQLTDVPQTEIMKKEIMKKELLELK